MVIIRAFFLALCVSFMLHAAAENSPLPDPHLEKPAPLNINVTITPQNNMEGTQQQITTDQKTEKNKEPIIIIQQQYNPFPSSIAETLWRLYCVISRG